MSLRLQKSKIVATIGPACDPQPVLEQMIRAGMSVAWMKSSPQPTASWWRAAI